MENLEPKLSKTTLSTVSSHGTQSSNSVRECSDPIPVDLLIDIFSRVPANSIARFRCVSKFWGSILNRPDFTELFLAKSLTRPRILFALYVDEQLIFYSSPQPQNPDENSSVAVTRYHTSFPSFYPPDIRTGSVFLLEQRRNSVICNPATGESVTLPSVQTETERIFLGYDPINKQFKVLCVTSSNTHLVLTLETGTLLWRTVEFKFHYKWYPKINNKICINGVIYFASIIQGPPMIVCFDVRSEKFGLIKIDEDMLPDYYHNSGPVGSMILVNFKGKLGVYMRPRRYNQSQQLVLWVLEDVKENKWSKHVYELPPGGKEIVCENIYVGMTDACEMVFESSYRESEPYFYHFYYNLERNTFKRVDFHVSKDYMDLKISSYTFLNYVENLKLM